jgi:hypothetical protein
MNKRSDAASEDIVMRGFNYTKGQVDDALTQVEKYVRQNPGQALLYAFVAGYVLNRLPVGGLLRGVVRLSIFGLKPAMLVYGATKVYEATTQDEE